jgi:hypothetical protein
LRKNQARNNNDHKTETAYRAVSVLKITHQNILKVFFMPWYNGDYPPSYKNQPKALRDKAVEIANKILETTGNEGEAIATGLKQARAHFRKEQAKKNKNKPE